MDWRRSGIEVDWGGVELKWSWSGLELEWVAPEGRNPKDVLLLAILLIVTLFSLESRFAYCNVECSPERRNSHYNTQNYFLAKSRHYNKQNYYQPRRSRWLQIACVVLCLSEDKKENMQTFEIHSYQSPAIYKNCLKPYAHGLKNNLWSHIHMALKHLFWTICIFWGHVHMTSTNTFAVTWHERARSQMCCASNIIPSNRKPPIRKGAGNSSPLAIKSAL